MVVYVLSEHPLPGLLPFHCVAIEVMVLLHLFGDIG